MILIVDDKPENLFSLGKILEVNRFEVDSALSGEEALKKVLKNEYELIILDVQMPEMDGFEVAEALSGYSKAKHTPILPSTSRSGSSSKDTKRARLTISPSP
jgi:two-component system, sensor histidine kinase and response regulator